MILTEDFFVMKVRTALLGTVLLGTGPDDCDLNFSAVSWDRFTGVFIC